MKNTKVMVLFLALCCLGLGGCAKSDSSTTGAVGKETVNATPGENGEENLNTITGEVGQDNPNTTIVTRDNGSFFFKESANNYNYAIISEDGANITDYIFSGSRQPEFINGVAIVENEDYETGVVTDEGKMIVNFGEYKKIEQKAGLLFLEDAEDSEKNKIITIEGKEIYKGEEAKLIYAAYDYLSIAETKDTYEIADYNGATLKSIKKTDDTEIYASGYRGHAVVYYAGINYVVDLANCNIIYELKSNEQYFVCESINAGNEYNANEVILVCGSHKVALKNGAILFETDASDETLKYDRATLICEGKNGDAIITADGKKIAIDGEAYAILDDQSYAVLKNNTVTIFKDGKSVATIENAIKVFAFGEDKYSVHMDLSVTNTKKIYTNEGEILNENTYATVNAFDKNGLAAVQQQDDNKVVLINENLEKVTDGYSKILNTDSSSSAANSTYHAFNLNKDAYMLGADGQILLALGDKTNESENDSYWVLKEGDTREVVDLQTGSIIFTASDVIWLHDKYFEVIKSGGGSEYYTYNSKSFYKK